MRRIAIATTSLAVAIRGIVLAVATLVTFYPALAGMNPVHERYKEILKLPDDQRIDAYLKLVKESAEVKDQVLASFELERDLVQLAKIPATRTECERMDAYYHSHPEHEDTLEEAHRRTDMLMTCSIQDDVERGLTQRIAELRRKLGE